MNPITQALKAGHSAEKILEYLSGTNSELASKIASALGVGYSAKAVLDFVFKAGKSVSNVLPTPNEEEQNLYKKQNYLEPGFKRSLMTGGALLGGLGMAATRGAAALGPEIEVLGAEAVESAVPQLEGPAQQQIEGMLPKQITQQARPIPPSDQPLVTPTQKGFKPTDALTSLVAGAGGFESLPIKKREEIRFIKNIADKFEKTGKTTEDPEVQKMLEKAKSVLSAKGGLIQEETERFKTAYPEMEVKESDIEKLIEPIKKGSQVLTASGEIATVEDLPGDTAKINIDGKKKVVKSDQIIDLPIPEKDLASLYDDLIGGIEKETKQQVSRNVYLAGYDPQNNELFYKPHDGALYVYNDIDKEDADALTNLLVQRKTTGKNYIGSWTKGTESPIGAAMSALILKLQKGRGGKGKEYIRKYDILYDMLEPAKKSKKEAFDKIKEREREKKRKQKAKKPGIS